MTDFSTSAGGQKTPQGRDKPAIIVGVLLLGLAGILWGDAVRLAGAVSYGVGPAAMPKIIAIGLVVLGLLSILSGFRNAGIPPEEAEFGPVLQICLGLVALTALIGFGAGFMPGMALLFVVTARAFGRRALLVDSAIGFTLGFSVYLLFTKLLTLSLPQGPLERLIGRVL